MFLCLVFVFTNGMCCVYFESCFTDITAPFHWEWKTESFTGIIHLPSLLLWHDCCLWSCLHTHTLCYKTAFAKSCIPNLRGYWSQQYYSFLCCNFSSTCSGPFQETNCLPAYIVKQVTEDTLNQHGWMFWHFSIFILISEESWEWSHILTLSVN